MHWNWLDLQLESSVKLKLIYMNHRNFQNENFETKNTSLKMFLRSNSSGELVKYLIV